MEGRNKLFKRPKGNDTNRMEMQPINNDKKQI